MTALIGASFIIGAEIKGAFYKHFNVEYRTQRANLFRSLPQHHTADINVFIMSTVRLIKFITQIRK